jgi:(1->4)-alpha-D-glucan 1-alpha-D-glucosylmutase
MHGYDVVAHAEINPELGGEEGFARFVAALKAHGLGQLLDMVPNHMGVFGADNAWWMDVLENGPASLLRAALRHRLAAAQRRADRQGAAAVLGVHYGEALDNGELVLRFEARPAASPSATSTTAFRSRPRATRWCWRGRSRLGDAASFGRAGEPGHRLRAPAGAGHGVSQGACRTRARQGTAQGPARAPRAAAARFRRAGARRRWPS